LFVFIWEINMQWFDGILPPLFLSRDLIKSIFKKSEHWCNNH